MIKYKNIETTELRLIVNIKASNRYETTRK